MTLATISTTTVKFIQRFEVVKLRQFLALQERLYFLYKTSLSLSKLSKCANPRALIHLSKT